MGSTQVYHNPKKNEWNGRKENKNSKRMKQQERRKVEETEM
jgi:hypothetical protein